MGLDTVYLIVEVEKKFGITIPDREAEKISTVGDFYPVVWNYLQQEISKRTSLIATEKISYQDVIGLINGLIADYCGLPITKITADQRITDDLGLD